MKKICVLSILFLFLTSTAFAVTQKKIPTDPVKEKEIKTKILSLQIPFIKNISQIKDTKVKYYANTFAGTVFVTDDEIIYGLKGWAVKERFLNAKKTIAEGIRGAETKVSYFKGSDQNNWKSNIPTYQEIGLGEIYDHITLNLKAYGKNIEKLFIIEKGGKPEDIAIKVERAKKLKVNEKGELEIETGIGTVKMTRPVAYQEIDSKRVEVTVAYTIPQSAVCNPHCKYGFLVKDYNKDYPLVIDPLLASTFVGGSSNDDIYDITIDQSGNVFLVGDTESSDYPTTTGTYDNSYSGPMNVIVSKLDNNLTSLLASTFIGGNSGGLDRGREIKIDQSGNVYISGKTSSPDYPTTPGAYDRSHHGKFDVFLSKLDNNLTTLLASTFLGGSGDDVIDDTMAIDHSGDVFIAGWTESPDFPTTTGVYDTSHNGNTDIFLSRLDGNLSTLKASTFIGGTNDDGPYAVVLDQSGNIFVTGDTESLDYPTTTEAYDTSYNGAKDLFLSKFNNTLTNLLASTFIGGTGDDATFGMDLDQSGNIFITGGTLSSDYPTTKGAYDTSYHGNWDFIVSKLNNTLTNLLASTFLGGSLNEWSFSVSVDKSGNVFVAGRAGSPDYPTTPGAYDVSYNGGEGYGDVGVSKLDNNLTTLLASTFLGGSGDDFSRAMAIDQSGDVFVEGCTHYATDFPTTPGSYDTSFNGERDIFVSRFDNNLSKAPTVGCSTWTDVIAKYNAYVGGQATWNDVMACYREYSSI